MELSTLADVEEPPTKSVITSVSGSSPPLSRIRSRACAEPMATLPSASAAWSFRSLLDVLRSSSISSGTAPLSMTFALLSPGLAAMLAMTLAVVDTTPSSQVVAGGWARVRGCWLAQE